ncbi:MAG: NCS2 family permease [Gemmatimonadetes bacterium]|nr:NCS2 family permease [Gemmatimonadota bacterium]
MPRLLDRLFGVTAAGSTVARELVAGTTTFATMSYIVFVQPSILAVAGMDFGAVLVATCAASALATLLMGLYANYPIAIAPGMGHNVFFAFSVVVAMGVPWTVALGADFIASALFVVLAAVKFREAVMDAIPPALKAAIPVGIGLLIAFVGLQWGGIVVDQPGALAQLGDLTAAPTLLALGTFLLIAVLHVRGVRGAILIGMIAGTLAGLAVGLFRYQGMASLPPSLGPTFLKLDIAAAFRPQFLEIVFVFFFLAVFDTVGTLLGVSAQAGFLRDGKLPRAGRALLSDAIGTTAGTLLGTSTVTAYIESAAGVSAGGRTGLANVATAALFVLTLFLYPLARVMGGGVPVAENMTLYPVTAAALMTIGYLMIGHVGRIRWDDIGDAVPAFLTIVGMPLTLSIADGLALGFVSHAVIRVLSGRAREVGWLAGFFALLFVLRFLLRA